jgi:hypothetical protein
MVLIPRSALLRASRRMATSTRIILRDAAKWPLLGMRTPLLRASTASIRFSNSRSCKRSFAFSPRMSREFCLNVPSSSIGGRSATPRGSRECRAPDAPAASRVEKNTRVSHHGHAGSPGIPRTMVLTVSFALLVTGLVCHHRRRDAKHHRQLDASVGASGPHDFAVRKPHARQVRSPRPPHPAPRS